MLVFSPNFDVKSIFFPNFGQGPFPKIAGKGPVDKAGFIQASLCKIQGLFKDFFKNLSALFKDYKIMKNIELHIEILLPEC